MKHMKLDEKDQDEMMAAVPKQSKYPYGLRIRLGKKELAKLGMKELPKVGTTIMLDAKATVESIHANESSDSSDKGIELQITHLGMEEDEDEKMHKTAEAMYGEKMGKKEGVR